MLLVVLLHCRSVLLERWLVAVVVVERDMLLHDADVDILANMDNSVVEAVDLGLGLDLYPRHQLDLVVVAAAVDAMLCDIIRV